MKYAVIQSGGKQYKVAEEKVIEIDKLEAIAGDQHIFDKVLLYVNDGAIQIGQPNLDNVSVTAKILDQIKGKKIRVAKFKAKARYRKVQGHRQHLTRVIIEKIAVSTKKDSKSEPSADSKIKSKDINKK